MSDKLNKLKELKELLDAKAITEKEFQELKKQAFINDIIKESEVIPVRPKSDTNLESSFPIKKNKGPKRLLIVLASIFLTVFLFKQLGKTGSSPNTVDDYIERSNQIENSEENTEQTNYNAYDTIQADSSSTIEAAHECIQCNYKPSHYINPGEIHECNDWCLGDEYGHFIK